MSSSIVGAGPAPSGVITPGSVARRGSPAASSRRGGDGLALAAHEGVEGACGVLEQLLGE